MRLNMTPVTTLAFIIAGACVLAEMAGLDTHFMWDLFEVLRDNLSITGSEGSIP